jgi:heterodisulfide reductase subunit B
MEFLTREALDRGIEPPVTEVKQFNEAFMREVRLWGRAYELGLMAEMKLRSGNITDDIDLGLKMVRKGKLAFLPSPARPPRRVRAVAGAASAIAYYPGCSLHSTAREFDESARAVCDALGLQLIEPRGWICCGSSAAHRCDPQEALRLPLENLALIEKSGFSEVTMPCAACFNRHKAALHEIRADEARKKEMDAALDYVYQDNVQVRTLIETIRRRRRLEQMTAATRKPLKGLRVVCYYGCLLTRPPEVTEAAHPENPTDMDDILAAMGADVVDWSYKTVCCGAAHSLTRTDIVLTLSRRLIYHARQAGADMMVVACPLCHLNLDSRQFQMGLEWTLPVLYFTQLMAIALGLPAKSAALHKNLVDPRPMLAEKGFVVT